MIYLFLIKFITLDVDIVAFIFYFLFDLIRFIVQRDVLSVMCNYSVTLTIFLKIYIIIPFLD